MCAQHILIAMLHAEMAAALRALSDRMYRMLPELCNELNVDAILPCLMHVSWCHMRMMLIALTVLMEERNAAGDAYRRCQKILH